MEEGDGTNSEITIFSSLSSSTRSQSETKNRNFKFSNCIIEEIKPKNYIHLTNYLVLLICAFCIVSITGPEIFKAKNIPGLDRKCTAFQDNIHQMLSKFKTRHANAFCYSNGTFQKYGDKDKKLHYIRYKGLIPIGIVQAMIVCYYLKQNECIFLFLRLITCASFIMIFNYFYLSDITEVRLHRMWIDQANIFPITYVCKLDMIKNARKFDPKTKTISVEATPYTSMCTDVFNHLYGFCIGVIYCGLILLGLSDMTQFIKIGISKILKAIKFAANNLKKLHNRKNE